MMKPIAEIIRKYPLLGWVLFITTVAIVYLASLLGYSIMERKMENKLTKQVMTVIEPMEVDNEKWKDNFPREYERYRSTKDGGFLSREGGNEMIDMLARDPRLVVLWAGYGFSKDYNQGRGHYNSIEDIKNSLRTNPTIASTCWTCKSPNVVRLIDKIGPDAFYSGKWVDLMGEMVNPIGCLDCHNPKNMNLTITRPALKEALEKQGRKIEEIPHQEMRSLVCAQCHVEYYFKKETNYLVFPWAKGKSVEDIESFYDEVNHVDWVHQLSKAPMLKAQHPDYEIWEMGIHAQRGVACADCHMPYRREGGVKFTDHKIQSPLANIANSCMVCHRESEETLRQNVFERQDKIRELRLKAEDVLVKAHLEAKAAWDAGATEEEMKPILTIIRHAQWRWDFAAAGHGSSFHAPLEIARILGTSLEKGQESRVLLSQVLSKHNVVQPVAIPDISSKEKAQAFIGLDVNKLIADKREFLKKLSP